MRSGRRRSGSDCERRLGRRSHRQGRDIRSGRCYGNSAESHRPGAGGFGTAAEINVYEYTGETPELTYHFVDDRDASLVYSGTWHDDSGSTFLNGTARYTSDANASVSFTFTGTAIQWYGQNDTNFGTANVYIDGVLVETVNVYGSMASQKLLFSRTGLTAGEHTIRIVRASATIDVDYFAYAN